MTEIRFRVFDNRSVKDITNEYQWVITPDGRLCYVEYDDVPDASSFAHYEILVKLNGTWQVIE